MFSSRNSIKDLKNKKFLRNKSNFVHTMFDAMADDYDEMNDIISFGRNIDIKSRVIEKIPVKNNDRILDICTGTGDMAVLIAEKLSSCHITGIDFSQNMLNIASEKSKKFKNIEFIQGDALDLPFEDNSFDVTLISYGLRNLADTTKGLLEMKRVTKEGGYVVNLDFGKSKGIYNRIFGLYFFNIVPIFRKFINKDFTLYKYIPKSNEDFPSQDKLVEIMRQIGLKDVINYNYAYGIIAQQIARV